MIEMPNLFLVGGNSRNSGKTTLACRLIAAFAPEYDIIGLKVTSFRPGDEDLHGHHEGALHELFMIKEEGLCESDKDTVRMLRAGARRSFYMQVRAGGILTALDALLKVIGKTDLVVCESLTLRDYVKPGIFALMLRADPAIKPKDVSDCLPYADLVIVNANDTGRLEEVVGNIVIKNQKWGFRKLL